MYGSYTLPSEREAQRGAVRGEGVALRAESGGTSGSHPLPATHRHIHIAHNEDPAGNLRILQQSEGTQRPHSQFLEGLSGSVDSRRGGTAAQSFPPFR